MVPTNGAESGADAGQPPILVYDDECGFCTWWTEWVAVRADLAVVGFSELSPELRERLPEAYEDGSHLVTDGEIHSFGASMEEAFLYTPAGALLRPVVERLRRIGAYRRVREWVYGLVRENRGPLGRVFSAEPPADVPARG